MTRTPEDKKLRRLLRAARKEAILDCKDIVALANLIPPDEVRGNATYPHAGILDEIELRFIKLMRKRS